MFVERAANGRDTRRTGGGGGGGGRELSEKLAWTGNNCRVPKERKVSRALRARCGVDRPCKGANRPRSMAASWPNSADTMPRPPNGAETSQTDSTTLVPARCDAAESRRRSAAEDEMADQQPARTARRSADRGSVVASTVCPGRALIDAASGERVRPSTSAAAGVFTAT